MSDSSEPVNWLIRWRQQDAWTSREFALLCGGVNPDAADKFKDDYKQERYNEARESINRAVRVKVLPTIDDLAWPATGAELIYDAVPAFKPCDVGRWAATRYPDTFPFSADEWDKDKSTKPSDDAINKQLGERERSTLLTIIAVLAEKARIDVSKPSKAGMEIETLTVEKGVRIAARTVEEHLKLIPDALERKGKTSA